MDDLIGRQAILDMLEDINNHIIDGYGYKHDWCVEWVNGLPSIDAVQVVRCKDCKYSYTMITARSKDGQERWTRFCDKHQTLFPKDDWFCADGERKE